MSKLHLVFGGRVKDPQGLEFTDLEKIDLVGLFDSYAAAEEAWRGAAQRSVDDAEMKYVVVHLHRLLEPGMEGISRPKWRPKLTQSPPSEARPWWHFQKFSRSSALISVAGEFTRL